MNIFHNILTALNREERVMLATIISTTGSTPAAALSKMLVTGGGIASLGTVGGGCMEGDVLLHARRLYDTGKAEILAFHLNEDDIEHGLICGGTLEVLIEPLTKSSLPLFEALNTLQEEGEDCIVATMIGTGGDVGGKYILASSTRHTAGSITSAELVSRIGCSPPEIDTLITKLLRRQEPQRLETEQGTLLLEPVTGSPALLIFGGGHVSKFLSRTAAMAGFRITVIDDRERFANAERFPEAARTIASGFLEAIASLTITPSTYIVIVTRGHRHDEEILERVIASPARYIGMIGSKRKVMTIYEHLMERGVSAWALRRVRAPIGIEIGAVTAEEIAVSIVAELIRVRRGENLPSGLKSDTMKNTFIA